MDREQIEKNFTSWLSPRLYNISALSDLENVYGVFKQMTKNNQTTVTKISWKIGCSKFKVLSPEADDTVVSSASAVTHWHMSMKQGSALK